MKPIDIRFVVDTNSGVWVVNMTAKVGNLTITWPFEEGYTSGGTLSFAANIVDYTFGAPDIQGMVEGSMTVQPSGIPTVVAGTHS